MSSTIASSILRRRSACAARSSASPVGGQRADLVHPRHTGDQGGNVRSEPLREIVGVEILGSRKADQQRGAHRRRVELERRDERRCSRSVERERLAVAGQRIGSERSCISVRRTKIRDVVIRDKCRATIRATSRSPAAPRFQQARKALCPSPNYSDGETVRVGALVGCGRERRRDRIRDPLCASVCHRAVRGLDHHAQHGLRA